MSEYKMFSLIIFALFGGLQHELNTYVNKQYTENLFRVLILLGHSTCDKCNNNIVTMCVTIDGIRIGEWIYAHDSRLHKLQYRTEILTDKCLGRPKCLQDNSSDRTTEKPQLLYCKGVFPAPLHSNGSGADHIENTVLILLHTCMLERYLAM
jgi:hypothetical protein